jgi:hypothetical protein
MEYVLVYSSNLATLRHALCSTPIPNTSYSSDPIYTVHTSPLHHCSRRNSILGVGAPSLTIPTHSLPPIARATTIAIPTGRCLLALVYSSALTSSWATWRNGGGARAQPSVTSYSPAFIDATAATSRLPQSYACILYMFVCPSCFSSLSVIPAHVGISCAY